MAIMLSQEEINEILENIDGSENVNSIEKYGRTFNPVNEKFPYWHLKTKIDKLEDKWHKETCERIISNFRSKDFEHLRVSTTKRSLDFIWMFDDIEVELLIGLGETDFRVNKIRVDEKTGDRVYEYYLLSLSCDNTWFDVSLLHKALDRLKGGVTCLM